MTPLSTEDFPYTISYVMELLALDERQLNSFVRALGLSPRQDEETGRTIFTHRDLEQIKKAADMYRQGEDLESIARRMGGAPSVSSNKPSSASLTAPPPVTGQASVLSAPSTISSVELPPTVSYKIAPDASSSPAAPVKTTLLTGQDNITAMVEAVSQVKEGILKDLGRLLDDKLAGLDEVVVELIRCKSENDSLKKKLHEALQARESLEQELARFKPVQFGFYRKS